MMARRMRATQQFVASPAPSSPSSFPANPRALTSASNANANATATWQDISDVPLERAQARQVLPLIAANVQQSILTNLVAAQLFASAQLQSLPTVLASGCVSCLPPRVL